MHVKMQIQNPEDIEVALTMTMPLKNWLRLKDQMAHQWPAFELRHAIVDATHQVTKVFFGEDKPEVKS